MQNSFLDFLRRKLSTREQLGLKRALTPESKKLIDFSSNDYLGLASSKELRDIIDHEARKLNLKNGSTGSRLLTGNYELTEQTEANLANTFQSESCLMFNSGYSANLAVLSSVPSRKDTILYDELAHACIKDGARLSLAKQFSFKHNDVNDLETKLKKASGRVYIAIESVYSMDGDEAPLREIIRIAEEYDAVIILDEAHSTGVTGNGGSGLSVEMGLHKRIPIRVYTFGKAMGVHGACVAGSHVIRDYLINFARPFIYTTALSPHSVLSVICAFNYLATNLILQDALTKNIQTFLSLTSNIVNRTASRSAIQNLIVPGNFKVREIATILKQNNIDVRPILSPTVPAGSERLRICLHSFNTEEEIKTLASLLEISEHVLKKD